ncbi:hypothetical protein MAR_000389 [Mya arenaria]|uniref:Uncharacterized protein n=1 Tax=Mya arenaria TaxID=6604 RepID=A0ABY7FH46_MYAAR|nr:hypothetical protein MAR_000389 [Mya arenaria]
MNASLHINGPRFHSSRDR